MVTETRFPCLCRFQASSAAYERTLNAKIQELGGDVPHSTNTSLPAFPTVSTDEVGHPPATMKKRR